MHTRLLFAIMFATISLQGQTVDPYNVPEGVKACFGRDGLQAEYELDGRINPFYIRGDFDGDGRLDYAVLVREKPTGKAGIVICQTRPTRAFILGAGKSFRRSDGYDFIDFRFEAWTVFGKQKVSSVCEEGPAPKLVGEAILVQWPERGAGIICWTGKTYRYYDFCG